MNVTDVYYPGEAFLGYGAQLLVGQGGDPQVFAAVADVNVITPGDMTTAVHDKTHLRSPHAHREKLAGLRDSGPFTLEGNWRPTHGSHSNAGGDGFATGMLGLWRTRQELDFKIVVPVATVGAAIAVTTITRVGGVATVTTGAAHGLATNDVARIAGASPPEYNGDRVVTVTSPTEFTYDGVSTSATTPATGTITASPVTYFELPFRGVVTRYQPGALGVDDKTGFSAEITPLSDFSAALP